MKFTFLCLLPISLMLITTSCQSYQREATVAQSAKSNTDSLLIADVDRKNREILGLKVQLQNLKEEIAEKEMQRPSGIHNYFSPSNSLVPEDTSACPDLFDLDNTAIDFRVAQGYGQGLYRQQDTAFVVTKYLNSGEAKGENLDDFINLLIQAGLASHFPFPIMSEDDKINLASTELDLKFSGEDMKKILALQKLSGTSFYLSNVSEQNQKIDLKYITLDYNGMARVLLLVR